MLICNLIGSASIAESVQVVYASVLDYYVNANSLAMPEKKVTLASLRTTSNIP